jgi:hypothetical protein
VLKPFLLRIQYLQDLLLYCCDAYLDASGRPCLEPFKLNLEEGGRDEDGGILWRLILDGGGWRYVDGGGRGQKSRCGEWHAPRKNLKAKQARRETRSERDYGSCTIA